ncbi:MAG: NADH-quinone oxidoreductase subunit D [Vampirovibrionales bacterium]|jgi:NADH:ubiquinone oxidoreductase subunit D|nr:NADH-quinone oxidoreductase subunit D [Vampirovibrionales bacterium]
MMSVKELNPELQSNLPGVSIETGFDTNDLVVNIGPQHPSTHGVLRLVTTLNGEVVKEMEPVIGYLHRSKEKMGESRSLFQYQPTIDRVEYLSSFYDHLVFVNCIEQIADIPVPKRVEYIRVICLELNRITSHLLWFGTFLLDLGASTPFFWCFRDREEVFTIFENLTGARMMYNYFRFGGVNNDIPAGWLEEVRAFCNHFPDRLDEYEAVATKNPIVMDRTKGHGIMAKEFCLKYGVTGPALRATGEALDLRKTNPYSVYSELDFDVPTRTECDTYARYLVRVQEMRESIKIIKQCIDKIPGGDGGALAILKKEVEVKTKEAKKNPEIVVPHWDKDWDTMGKKINLLTYKPPAGEASNFVESPRGVLGCYIITDGTPKAYRIKWRGASFSNLSALPELMKGHMYSDLMAIFGSLDVIMPEVDR